MRTVSTAASANAVLAREAYSRKRLKRIEFYERYYQDLPPKVAAHHMGLTERTIRRYRKAIKERQETA